MNMEEARTINTVALREFGILLNIPDDRMDEYIEGTRNKFMEYQELRVSEALENIMKDHNIDDIILGAITMVFMSDYVFDAYFKGEL